MNDAVIYIIKECYAIVLCVAIIVCLLLANKRYNRKMIGLFSMLCVLILIESVTGAAERLLGGSDIYDKYYQVRHVLAWFNYVVSPAILLAILELVLRDAKKWIKLSVTVPEIINIIVVSTTFWSPLCFTISESNNWQQGSLYIITQYVPIVYLIILLAIAFVIIRKNKWESVIILVSSTIIIISYIIESKNILPVSLRELTVTVTVMAYFMYFAFRQYMDEINSTYEKRHAQETVDQCIETLAYTIDTKDRYMKGHSARVAKYSRMIAHLYGKTEEECRQVYLAALLHDIGKISISDKIINEPGRLTDEEFAQMRKHSENGAKILERMKSMPYVQNVAKFHHERYDGMGYPMGLKGEEIPELARIIAVADAYDAMTSRRSYRNAMDQVLVKQEIWKGMGTQFDPMFSKLMISLIDADNNYDMREKEDEIDDIKIDEASPEIVWEFIKPKEISEEELTLQDTDFSTLGAFVCVEEHWCDPTDGVIVMEEPLRVRFKGVTRPDAQYVWNAPVILVYSSDNGKVLGNNYDELAVLMCAGYSWRAGSALYETTTITRTEKFDNWDNWIAKNKEGLLYTVSVRREKDTIIVRASNDFLVMDAKIKLPKGYKRTVYFSFTGERSDIQDIVVF